MESIVLPSFQDEEESNPSADSNLFQALQRLTNLHPELTSRPKLRTRVRPKRLKTSQDICDLVLGGERTRDFSNLFRIRIPDSRDPIPVRTMTLAESSREHPGVPHSWLCNGKLLVLEDPTNLANINLFQVSRVYLNLYLFHLSLFNFNEFNYLIATSFK